MIGSRLKEERERLGYTQPQFAELAGAKKRTLIDWEKGVSSPTAVQLSALAEIGVDVLYVITGVPSLVGSFAAQHKREEQSIKEGMTPRVGDLPKLTVGEYLAPSDKAGISQREAALLNNYRACKEVDQKAIERVALNAAAAKQEVTPKGKRVTGKR